MEKKVLLNAPDSEYAWNLLERTGLRKKLIEMDGDRKNIQDSLSWWMNKEPLRSKPLGEGRGKTAAQIAKENGMKELIVAHETNNFQAYENITRSSQGRANAFISRSVVAGEAAVSGNGFYTAIGTQGARGTNLTIRFKVDPEAREGEDFKKDGSYLIFNNKNALTLIQENINLNLLDFIKLILGNDLGKHDKGLLLKLERKFKRIDSKNLKEETQKGLDYILDNVNFFEEENFRSDFLKFNNIDYNDISFSDLLKASTVGVVTYFNNKITRAPFSEEEMKVWADKPGFVFRLFERLPSLTAFMFIQKILSTEFWTQYPDIISSIIDLNKSNEDLVNYVLSNSYWCSYPQLIEKVFSDRKVSSSEILSNILSGDCWAKHPDLLKSFIKIRSGSGIAEAVVNYIVGIKQWRDALDIFDLLIANDQFAGGFIIQFIEKNSDIAFAEPNYGYKALKKILSYGGDIVKNQIAELLYTEPRWFEYEDIFEVFIDNGDAPVLVLETFKNVVWLNHPNLIRKLFNKIKNTWSFYSNVERTFVESVLKNPVWFEKNPELMIEILEEMLKDSKWHPFIANDGYAAAHWTAHPEYLEDLILSEKVDQYIDGTIFYYDHWKQHPELIAYVGQENVNLTGLRNKMRKVPFRKWLMDYREGRTFKGAIKKTINGAKAMLSFNKIKHAFSCQQVLD